MKGLTKAQLALLAIKKKMKQDKTEKPIPLPQSFDELKARRKVLGQGFYVDKHKNIQQYRE
tara:strand:- start:2155 stop:2337 length:183 start_codon:yes stop_codon:yes gene_type:complete